jgi:hypothetical protein
MEQTSSPEDGSRLQIQRVATNRLNKQSRKADDPPTREMGEGLTASHYYEMLYRASGFDEFGYNAKIKYTKHFKQ